MRRCWGLMPGSTLTSNSPLLPFEVPVGILRVFENRTDVAIASNIRTARQSTSALSGMSSTGRPLRAGSRRKLKAIIPEDSIEEEFVL